MQNTQYNMQELHKTLPIFVQIILLNKMRIFEHSEKIVLNSALCTLHFCTYTNKHK